MRSGEGSVYANLTSILKRKGTIAITNNTTVEVQEIAYSSINRRRRNYKSHACKVPKVSL